MWRCFRGQNDRVQRVLGAGVSKGVRRLRKGVRRLATGGATNSRTRRQDTITFRPTVHNYIRLNMFLYVRI
jgi:hypothetical protein